MIGWFRVPPWCLAVHDEEAAVRARAWIYVLGSWDAGDDPPTREIRRVTGFGQGRADALVRDVCAWAIENGARYPARVAEQQRSKVGAAAERPDKGSTPKAGAQRSDTGAASEQRRSVSRARFLLQGEETVDVDVDLEFRPAPQGDTLDPQQQEQRWTPTATSPPAGTSSRPVDGQDRTATVNAPSTAGSPAPRGLSPTEADLATMTTATRGPTTTDEPPPPSDKDYYASETSEGAAINGHEDPATMDDPRVAGVPPTVVRDVVVRATVNAPPQAERGTAAASATRADQGRGPRSGRDADELARGAGSGMGDALPRVGRVVDQREHVQHPGRTPGLFGALNGPATASVSEGAATPVVGAVKGEGGAKARAAREPKAPTEPKPVPVANRLIGEWLASHLAAHGEDYVITAVCAKKLRELVKDEPLDADLSGWRAAFDAFNRKGFSTSPKGFTAMGFSYDPVLWQQTAKAYAAGVNVNRRTNTNDDNRRASIAMLDHALAQLENK